MKRFIIACCVLLVCAGAVLYAYFYAGVYIGGYDAEDVKTTVKQEGKQILLDQGQGLEPFEIRGVDMGLAIPGHFATDYAIDKETYLRWFRQIKEMGANTIRVYILQGSAFYEAFYEYNKDNPDPLYLIHGVWIEDYAQNSHMSGFSPEYLDRFKEDVRTMIDVLHGNRPIELGRMAGTGSYTKDVSSWVVGYILGVEWESQTVAYTDMEEEDQLPFVGEYLSTTDDASPFEAMLAEVGNEAFRYETDRYGDQRLVAFSNWPQTDPFEYIASVEEEFRKYEQIDIEHIVPSEKVKTGTFASYHVYPYYPDYFRYGPAVANNQQDQNTYRDYLAALNTHHTVPVVISEFGIPAARGMTYLDENTNRNQGHMTEEAQGKALARCYQDIKDAGCAGSIIFSWQDEWFKRTWNTIANVDLLKAPFWSDYQTNEQYFGLLSFDPGKDRCVSYVDGDDEEWAESDIVSESEGRTLSIKYDAKFVYFMVRGEGVSKDSPLYMPIDTTQKSGSTHSDDPAVDFDRDADFLMLIDGEEDSRVLVQERYEVLRATSLRSTEGQDPYVNPPEKDSSAFKPINLVIRLLTDAEMLKGSDAANELPEDDFDNVFFYQLFETGALVEGDANPNHEGYNSIADYCFGDELVEIRIPWQLLNFSNPSEMQIHDDYYECYGVENQGINEMYVGVGDGAQEIHLSAVDLEGWGTQVEYHERLKQSYYIIQQMWAYGVDPQELWDTGEDESSSVESKVTTVIRTQGQLLGESEEDRGGPVESDNPQASIAEGAAAQ